MNQQDAIFSSKHPRTTYLLAITEMLQRFSYVGIHYLLVLFLVQQLHYSIPEATKIFGIYTGLTACCYLLGGYISDKWNDRSPIFLGMILLPIGSFLLVFSTRLFLIPALVCIGLGGALFHPTIYSLLGRLYTRKYHIRDGGFSIYYVVTNLGGFFGLIVLGYLQTWHFSYAFFLATLVPLLGLFPYRKAMQEVKTMKKGANYFVSKGKDPNPFPLKRHEKQRIVVILIIIASSFFFWIAYNQLGSSILLFALKHAKKDIGSFSFPSSWFPAAYLLCLILFALPLTNFHLFLRRIKSSASPPMRTALSLFFLGLSFMVLQRAAAPLYGANPETQTSSFYLLVALALMATAELFLAPLVFVLTTNLSPHRYRGVLKACWFITMGIGLYVGGELAGYMTTMRLSSFFDLFAFTSFIPAFFILLFSKKLDAMRHVEALS